MANLKARLSDGTIDPNAAAKIIDTAQEAMMFYSGRLLGRVMEINYEAPTPLQHAPRVEDLLSKFQLPINGARFWISGSKLTPVLGTVNRNSAYVTLQLSGYPTELRGSPKEKIAAARKVMIDLLVHELDEWLFKVGLADDPHTCWNEQDNAELNHIYERGTAQL